MKGKAEIMILGVGKDDLRLVKTQKAVSSAFLMLLGQQNFRKLTVRDICEVALISRATFYSHFTDKYDLLKSWIQSFKPDIEQCKTYVELEKTINDLAKENKAVLKNILDNADSETSHIVLDFIRALLFPSEWESQDSKENPRHAIFSNFFAGGMVHYILWSLADRTAPNLMNIHIYNIIECFKSLGR